MTTCNATLQTLLVIVLIFYGFQKCLPAGLLLVGDNHFVKKVQIRIFF